MEARLASESAILLAIMMSVIQLIAMTEILLPIPAKQISTAMTGEMVALIITVMEHKRKDGRQWQGLAPC